MNPEYSSDQEYLVISLNPNWTGATASQLNAVRIRAIDPIAAVRERMNQVAHAKGTSQRFVVTNLVTTTAVMVEWTAPLPPAPTIKIVQR